MSGAQALAETVIVEIESASGQSRVESRESEALLDGADQSRDSSGGEPACEGSSPPVKTPEEIQRQLEHDIETACSNREVLGAEWRKQLYLFGIMGLPKWSSFFRKTVALLVVCATCGSTPLAGATIGLAFTSVFGVELLYMVVHRATSLFALSVFQRKLETALPYLLHSITLGLFFCIPFTILFCYSKSVLVSFGQSPDIASIAHSFILAFIPNLFVVAILHPTYSCLWMTSLAFSASQHPGEASPGEATSEAAPKSAEAKRQQTLRVEEALLQAAESWPNAYATAVIHIILDLLYIPLCWFLIGPMQLGVRGAAWMLLGADIATSMASILWIVYTHWSSFYELPLALAGFSMKGVSMVLTGIKPCAEFLDMFLLHILVLISGCFSHPVSAIATMAVILVPITVTRATAYAMNKTLYFRTRLQILRKDAVQLAVSSCIAISFTIACSLSLVVINYLLLQIVVPLVEDSYVHSSPILFTFMLGVFSIAAIWTAYLRGRIRALGWEDMELTTAVNSIFKVALPVLGLLLLISDSNEARSISLCVGILVAQVCWLFQAMWIRKRQSRAALYRAQQLPEADSQQAGTGSETTETDR